MPSLVEPCNCEPTVKNVEDGGKNRLAVVCSKCGEQKEYL